MRASYPRVRGSTRWRLSRRSGAALQLVDLFGLGVGALLRAGHLLLGLALALLHPTFLTEGGVVGEVARRLLHTSADLVGYAHDTALPEAGGGESPFVAASTSATVIARRPGSGRVPWGSPRPPRYSTTWRDRSGGGPHSDGGVGPNNSTDGTPNAVARCATPVSPHSTRPAPATIPASARRSVR